MENLITSQDFIDADIVAAKIADGDFEILVSPAFEIDGVSYRVLLDGHHSFAASVEAGADPVVIEATATMHDAVALLGEGNIEDFLAVTHMGSDYHFAASGKAVW